MSVYMFVQPCRFVPRRAPWHREGHYYTALRYTRWIILPAINPWGTPSIVEREVP